MRRGKKAAVAFLLTGFVAACTTTESARPSAWAEHKPRTPLPAFAGELGRPCRSDWGTQPLYVRCGRDGRISITVYSDYAAITGKRTQTYRGDPAGKPFDFPPSPHAVTTLRRSGDLVNELTLYTDGPYVWLQIATEVPEQFPRASLVIADRRHLSSADRAWLKEALGIDSKVDLDDDDSLRRALLARSLASRK